MAVIAFGSLGFYRRRWLLLAFTGALLVISTIPISFQPSGRVAFFIGNPALQLRLLAAFCVGSCFFIFKDRIRLSRNCSLLCIAALLFAMHLHLLEPQAMALFGGYVLFWLGMAYQSRVLRNINDTEDVSYGVYLYGWPISSLLVYCGITHNAPVLIGLSIGIALMAGAISWFVVERRFVRHARPRVLPVAASITP